MTYLNKKLLVSVLIISVALLLLGCKKMRLTRKTEEGRNTFSCIMNGKIFKPCDAFVLGGHEPLEGWVVENPSYYPGSPAAATISASCPDDSRDVTIYLKHFTGEGTYDLSDPNNLITCRTPGTYTSDSLKDGSVTITKYVRSERILSGTFKAVLSDYGGANKVILKDGRFDITYQ